MPKRKSRMFGFVTETWNPIVGCSHNCVYCWARRQAQRQKKNCPKCGWFTPHLHEERLNRKFKPNTLVFVCDMADLFCNEVLDGWIRKVLHVIHQNPKTLFFLETKNPDNMQFFDIPKTNTVLSVTIETNKVHGELPKIGRWSYSNISQAIPVDLRFQDFYFNDYFEDFRKHVSIEPVLDFDLEEFLEWILDIKPSFGVSVGYDNYGCRLPEPPLAKTLQLIEQLEKHGIKVERKTLRKAWWEVG